MKNLKVDTIYSNLDKNELVVEVFNPKNYDIDFMYGFDYDMLCDDEQKCVKKLKSKLSELDFDEPFFAVNKHCIKSLRNMTVGHLDIIPHIDFMELIVADIGFVLKVPYTQESVTAAVKFIKRLIKKKTYYPYSLI